MAILNINGKSIEIDDRELREFCGMNCINVECDLHPSHIKHPELGHTFVQFEYCENQIIGE